MFQALDGVVIRRREEIAILRALGVTERSVQRAFLVEAGLLGLVAGVLGVLLGWAGAQLAVGGVAQTMTALYGASSATYAALHGDEALLGIGLCVLTSVAGGMAACDSGGANGSGTGAESSCQSLVRRQAVAFGLGRRGLTCGGSGAGPSRPLACQRCALAHRGVCLGAVLVARRGLGASGLLRWFRPSSDPVRNVAFSHLRLPSIRHRFAIAALTSAVAMTCGMAIMIASFDHTMRDWVLRSMKADIYVSSAGAQSASSTHVISTRTLDAMRVHPGIAEIVALNHASAPLADGPVHVLGVDVPFTQRYDLYAWVQRPADDWQRASNAVLINESLSERLTYRVGDEIPLPTPQGVKTVRIAGIYADYGNERGSITLAQPVFHDWFASDQAWRVAIMLKPGINADAVATALQQQHPGLSIFTQSHLAQRGPAHLPPNLCRHVCAGGRGRGRRRRRAWAGFGESAAGSQSGSANAACDWLYTSSSRGCRCVGGLWHPLWRVSSRARSAGCGSGGC